jgi:hypothetical protein
MKMSFPNPDDILNFTLTIEPDEGMYKGGAFHFNFTVNQNFPHDPPKVKCTQKIYHPNIDLEGNVCLNILREDWKPVLNLNAVIVGMQVCLFLFFPFGIVFGCFGERERVWMFLEGVLLIFLPCLVPLPGTECFRSAEQGGRRRSETESGSVQAQR